MMKTFQRSGLAALACIAAFALATPAIAATVNLKADLKAASEVPPTDSKGSGSVTATFDTASKKLSWKGNVSGLSGPATAAHFHAGEAGKNGGVVVPIAGGPFICGCTLCVGWAQVLWSAQYRFGLRELRSCLWLV